MNVRPEKIVVNNDTLMSKFMEQVHEFLDEPEPEIKPMETPRTSLGRTDVFNLNYLKSGGALKVDPETGLKSGGSMTFLPKIKHTSVESPYPPK